jgi:cytoskeleton protein RodZ
MTDEISNTQEAATESTKATPGQQLRQGREAMGLSQQQVADRLHLRLNNIQDIESDTHKPGVSITFTKGYVRIYAKLLGMPSESLLEAFDILHQGEKQPAKLQSFSQRVARQANDDRWMMVTYLIIFLVLASLVIWWFQQSDTSDKPFLERFSWFTSASSEDASAQEGELVDVLSREQESALPTADLPDELEVTEQEVVQQSTDTSPTASDFISEAEDIAEPIVDDAAALVTEGVEIAQDQIEQVADDFSNDDPVIDSGEIAVFDSSDYGDYEVNSDGTVDLVFTFSEDCWLQVTDANDDVMAVGVKVKGRVMPVSGVPPISVNMCPPETVKINFAGQDVDLSQYRRGVPVKFELSVTGE